MNKTVLSSLKFAVRHPWLTLGIVTFGVMSIVGYIQEGQDNYLAKLPADQLTKEQLADRISKKEQRLHELKYTSYHSNHENNDWSDVVYEAQRLDKIDKLVNEIADLDALEMAKFEQGPQQSTTPSPIGQEVAQLKTRATPEPSPVLTAPEPEATPEPSPVATAPEPEATPVIPAEELSGHCPAPTPKTVEQTPTPAPEVRKAEPVVERATLATPAPEVRRATPATPPTYERGFAAGTAWRRTHTVLSIQGYMAGRSLGLSPQELQEYLAGFEKGFYWNGGRPYMNGQL
jgi:hypothetical protein